MSLKFLGRLHSFWVNKERRFLNFFFFGQDFLRCCCLGGGDELRSLPCCLLPTLFDFYKVYVPNEKPTGQMTNVGNGLSRQCWERGWRQITLCTCPLTYGYFASRFHAGISGKVTFFLPPLLPFMWPGCHWNSSDVHPLLADFLMIGQRKHSQQFTNKQIKPCRN